MKFIIDSCKFVSFFLRRAALFGSVSYALTIVATCWLLNCPQFHSAITQPALCRNIWRKLLLNEQLYFQSTSHNYQQAQVDLAKLYPNRYHLVYCCAHAHDSHKATLCECLSNFKHIALQWSSQKMTRTKATFATQCMCLQVPSYHVRTVRCNTNRVYIHLLAIVFLLVLSANCNFAAVISTGRQRSLGHNLVAVLPALLQSRWRSLQS